MVNFNAVGHIANDIVPFKHIGGGVSYSGVVVRKLGVSKVSIITKCTPNHPYLQELESYGISAIRLPNRDPSFENRITTFKNYYDKNGRRVQKASNIQEPITTEDLPYFPVIEKGSIILVAPIANEIDERLFPELAAIGNLVITPQGYFREIQQDGKVKHARWQHPETVKYAKTVILSDEDITFDGEPDQRVLKNLTDACPLVVLTQGKDGSTIYVRGEKPLHITAFPLQDHEIMDLTGAGDSYAAAFFTDFFQTDNVVEAGAFASYFSALKIAGLGGKEGGIKSIPTIEIAKDYLQNNPERVQNHLEKNGLRGFSILEGHTNHLESEY